MSPIFVELAKRNKPQTIFCVVDSDDGAIVFAQDFRHRQVRPSRGAAKLLAVGACGILVLEEAMQEGSVRGIDADFERLQPVATDVALEREGVAVRRDKTVDLRKCRRGAFAQICPEDAALLYDGIGALP